MIVEAEVTINAPRAAVWAAITDVASAPAILSGVEKIEIVAQPPHGLVGLRWRETRLLYGKPATAEKWITAATDEQSYETRAEDGGFVFTTTKVLSESGGRVTLKESHESRPRTLGARLMLIPMALFFKGVIRKAVQQDLDDFKAALEKA